MSIASRITEIETHIGDIYDELEIGGADLTNVNKNIVNIKNQLIDRYLDYLNNGTQEIWDNWEKVTGTGTTLNLNPTEHAPMKIDLKGNTSQSGTPTPTSPQPVHVVSGDNVSSICSDNVFNPNEDIIIANIASYATTPLPAITNNYNVTIDSENVLHGTASPYMAVARPFNFVAGKTIYNRGYLGERSFLIYDENRNVVTHLQNVESYTPQNTFRGYLGLGLKSAENVTGKVVMFSYSPNASFEPYIGQDYHITLPTGMELCGIGDYKDKPFKAVNGDETYDSLTNTQKEGLTIGKWYLYKEIGKVVYTGDVSEDWTQDIYSGVVYWYNHIVDSKKGARLIDVLLSTHFEPNGRNDENGFYLNNQRLIVFNHGIASTLAGFKTWLSTHNPSVYYVLNTPTTIEITDTTLIEQLEEIRKAKSYENQTNISQVNNDLPFILNVSALKKEA